MSALNDAAARLAVINAMPKPKPGEFLTIDELEAIAFHFGEYGVSILAAEGVRGPEWLLTVPIKGVQTSFRAHRVVAVSA